MSEKIKKLCAIDSESMGKMTERIVALKEEGIQPTKIISDGLNFSGCHRGYCQAWA